MNKDVIILVLKCIIAIASALLGVFGVASLSSCTAQRNVESIGTTRIIVTDTTVVNHTGNYSLTL